MLLRCVLVAAAAAAAAAADDAQLQCATCGMVTNWLTQVLNNTADELAAAKQQSDQRKDVDRVQKAQTKRWLKLEYGAALSAAVQDELEHVCTRDKLSQHKAIKASCNEFLDAHYDTLPRAVLDHNDEWCDELYSGCTGAARKAAIDAYTPTLLSEPKPKKSNEWVGPNKSVFRLVGKTFTPTVNRYDKHTVVMLFTSSPEGSTPPPKFSAAALAFYELAHAVNRSKTPPPVRFAQMDLRHNSVPGWLELASPEGLQLLLWLKGDKSKHPEMLPMQGEPDLADAEKDEIRKRLMQMLITHLKGAEGHALRKAAEQLEAGAGAAGAGEAGAFTTKTQQRAAQPPSGRAKRKASDAAPKASLRRAQTCEVCGLVSLRLHEALEEKKKELELSHEANRKKQQHIEKVQKAQTKRWLKQEYGAALAAALEDKLDGLCRTNDFKASACLGSLKGVGSSMLRTPDERPFSMGACELRLQERCDDVLGDHSDELMRATLDGKGADVCTELVRNCREPNAQLFNRSRIFHLEGDALGDAAKAAQATKAEEEHDEL
tara:strand:- start:2041 stop:3681 length:1641 start_codon:yes stop_codon:yes gene_type:complete